MECSHTPSRPSEQGVRRPGWSRVSSPGSADRTRPRKRGFPGRRGPSLSRSARPGSRTPGTSQDACRPGEGPDGERGGDFRKAQSWGVRAGVSQQPPPTPQARVGGERFHVTLVWGGPWLPVENTPHCQSPGVTRGEGFACISRTWVLSTGPRGSTCHRKPPDDPRVGPYASGARSEGAGAHADPHFHPPRGSGSRPCRAQDRAPAAAVSGPTDTRSHTVFRLCLS